MQTFLLISAGAIVGANLRYLIATWAAKAIPSSFPSGTLIINITASFLLGFFLVWTSERITLDPRWRTLFAVGFCATYSTYSSFAFETWALAGRGQTGLAIVNVLATNIVCLLAVMLGAALARSL